MPSDPGGVEHVSSLGAVPGRPRLAELLGRAQYESTMDQAGYLAEFQRRGWLRGDLDVAAISAFMTATFLGRVVDDIAEQPVDPGEWTKVAVEAFRAILFAPLSSAVRDS